MKIGIDWPNDQQLVAAWKIFDALKTGQVAVVRDFAKNKPGLFIQAGKLYIDCFKSLEFNNDYSKIKRIC